MIYLVTKQQTLFEYTEFKGISPEESLRIMNNWEMIQYDSETTGGFD